MFVNKSELERIESGKVDVSLIAFSLSTYVLNDQERLNELREHIRGWLRNRVESLISSSSDLKTTVDSLKKAIIELDEGNQFFIPDGPDDGITIPSDVEDNNDQFVYMSHFRPRA